MILNDPDRETGRGFLSRDGPMPGRPWRRR